MRANFWIHRQNKARFRLVSRSSFDRINARHISLQSQNFVANLKMSQAVAHLLVYPTLIPAFFKKTSCMRKA